MSFFGVPFFVNVIVSRFFFIVFSFIFVYTVSVSPLHRLGDAINPAIRTGVTEAIPQFVRAFVGWFTTALPGLVTAVVDGCEQRRVHAVSRMTGFAPKRHVEEVNLDQKVTVKSLSTSVWTTPWNNKANLTTVRPGGEPPPPTTPLQMHTRILRACVYGFGFVRKKNVYG